MARREIVTLIDDLDGTPAAETIRFALDGVQYEIDLSEQNAAALRDQLGRFVSAARRVSSGSRRVRRGSADRARIRRWAKENGLTVSDRGRIPAEVVAAYEAAVRT
jgi:hypothetical protein